MSRAQQYEIVANATSKALKKCWNDPKWKAEVLAKRALRQGKTNTAQARAMFNWSKARHHITFAKWQRLSKNERMAFMRHVCKAERYGVSVAAYHHMTRGERFALALNYNKEKNSGNH